MNFVIPFLIFSVFTGEKVFEIKKDKVKVEFTFMGKVEMRPASGNKLKVSYVMPDSFSKYFVMEESEEGYRIGFEKLKNVIFKDLKDSIFFTIELPDEVVLDIEIGAGAIEGDIELGELRVRKLSLDLGAGELSLNFSKPNKIVMDKMEINTGAAELEIKKLGNARFIKGEINAGVVSVDLDLGGEWKKGASLYITSGIASFDIKAPKGLEFNVIKEGILNPGLGKIVSKDPVFTLHFEGALNALNFEEYEEE